jgi:hypothetical protein
MAGFQQKRKEIQRVSTGTMTDLSTPKTAANRACRAAPSGLWVARIKISGSGI